MHLLLELDLGVCGSHTGEAFNTLTRWLNPTYSDFEKTASKFSASNRLQDLVGSGIGIVIPELESIVTTQSTNSRIKSSGLIGPGAKSFLAGKKSEAILLSWKKSGS
jgi:hypothetical protein